MGFITFNRKTCKKKEFCLQKRTCEQSTTQESETFWYTTPCRFAYLQTFQVNLLLSSSCLKNSVLHLFLEFCNSAVFTYMAGNLNIYHYRCEHLSFKWRGISLSGFVLWHARAHYSSIL